MEQANSGVTVRYSERQGLASCIVSRQAGLTLGLEPQAVPVISSPSGSLGPAHSQTDMHGALQKEGMGRKGSVCVCWKVGGFCVWHLQFRCSLSSPAQEPHRDQTSARDGSSRSYLILSVHSTSFKVYCTNAK